MFPSFLSIRAARVAAVVILAIAASTQAAQRAWALGQEQYVQFSAAPGGFTIVSANTTATIYVDSKDWAGVLRAANDLSNDIHDVTGKTPKVISDAKPAGRNIIIIGTLGKSDIIDQLVAAHKIDVSAIQGKWESYFTQVVRNPLPGVDSALIICGSDKRGSIYGIYDLSEESGQSPWYYWADVPAKKHAELHVKAGKFSVGEPSVKYRGIFFNDEAPSLSGYIHAKYGDVPQNSDPTKGPIIPAGVANYGHEFYSHVFELLLRCKGNYLWPAMWNNAFNEDDPADAPTADLYGIVMGTSHQEPMMRAQKEWDRLPRSITSGSWNYATHPDVLDKFWGDGLTRNKNYEQIITMGLRGENDSEMVKGQDQAIDLLNKILPAQREIIAETVNPDVTKVPQVWALYKEVQNYYETGRLHPPDDITLLWAEDNNGNVRRLPTAEERKRSGGAGIYYHFDYHGGPTDFRWVNTSPISRVWDQMSLAKQYSADRIWIVNVGKLKNIEFATDYFLNLGWSTTRWTNDTMREYTRLWATREFGPQHANEIADIARKDYANDAELMKHYNTEFAGGKWNHFQDDVHIGYTSWAEPKAPSMAQIHLTAVPATNPPALGVAVENSASAWPGGEGDPALPGFNSIARQKRYIDVFNCGTGAVQFTATPSAPWIITSASKGSVAKDQRLWISIDWSKAPKGTASGTVKIAQGDTAVNVKVDALSADPKVTRETLTGFVEDAGVVSIEPEHYTAKTDMGDLKWIRVQDYGRTLSAMRGEGPVEFGPLDPAKGSPHLEYKTYFFTSGEATVNSILAPNLAFIPGRDLRFAISIDDQAPVLVTGVPTTIVANAAPTGTNVWQKNVMDEARTVSAKVQVPSAGYHTLKVWMVDPGITLQKIVIDLGTLKPSYLGPPESYNKPMTLAHAKLSQR